MKKEDQPIVKKLSLGPNDVVVVSYPQQNILPQRYIRKQKEELAKLFPDNKIVMLAGGMTISIISKEHFNKDLFEL